MAPPQLGGDILKNGAPSTDFYSSLALCVIIFSDEMSVLYIPY